MDLAGSTFALQEKLQELWERQGKLKKAIEIEETTIAKDDGLANNRQYSHAQDELTKIPDRRDRALEEITTKQNAYKEIREARIKAIEDETERYIEAYKAKRQLEIAALQKEIEVKEAIFLEKKAAIEKRYDDLSKGYGDTCRRIEEACGSPQSIAFRRKKTELDMVSQQVLETQALLERAFQESAKRAKEEARRAQAELDHQERLQLERDRADAKARREAEEERDRRRREEREQRKRKMREEFEDADTLEKLYDVRAKWRPEMDWEDEDYAKNFLIEFRRKNSAAAAAPAAPAPVPAPVPEGAPEIISPSGPAKLLTSTLKRKFVIKK